MSEWINFIQSVGFPIFVAVYLLIFWQRTMEKFENALTKLDNSNRIIIDKIDALSERK